MHEWTARERRPVPDHLCPAVVPGRLRQAAHIRVQTYWSHQAEHSLARCRSWLLGRNELETCPPFRLTAHSEFPLQAPDASKASSESIIDDRRIQDREPFSDSCPWLILWEDYSDRSSLAFLSI